MLKGREIISLPIITLDNNKQIGEVKNLIYDYDSGLVLGYIVENKGWLRDARAIAHQDVVNITQDAIFIKKGSDVKKVSEHPVLKEHLNTKIDVLGMRIENPEGSCLGVVQDLVLEGMSGKITGFEVSDGVVQDLLNGRTTIQNETVKFVGDKFIITNDYY